MVEDNLGVAVDDAMDGLDLSISSGTGAKPGAPAVKQIICRATSEEHERWKKAAELLGQSLNEFIRNCVREKADTLVDCQHPWEYRKRYPWSEFCLQCGQRLRG